MRMREKWAFRTRRGLFEILLFLRFHAHLALNTQFLIGEDGCQLLSEDLQKNTAFHLACAHSNLEMAKCLFKAMDEKHETKEDDVILNRVNSTGSTPLILSVQNKKKEIVKVSSICISRFLPRKKTTQ